MDTLDRYLLKEYLSYFLLVWIGLAALFLGIDFLSKFLSGDKPVSWMLQLYAYRIPAALQRFIPVACLMATLLVLSSMSRQNEVLALYASGIGTFRLISTFVAVVATISTFTFLAFDSLVPLFSKKQILMEKGQDPSAEFILSHDQGGFWYRSGNVIYNVGRFIPESNTLEDIKIYLLSPTFRLMEMMHARIGNYVNNDWVLKEGFVVSYPESPPYPVATPFKEKSHVIPDKPGDFKTLKIEDGTMRLRDLRRSVDRNKAYGFDTTSQQVSYHERLSLIFTPLVFVLLGIPFAIRPLRTHSMAKSVGFCFLVVSLYLLMSTIVVSIGRGGHIPPIVAGWATNVAFFIASWVFIFRM